MNVPCIVNLRMFQLQMRRTNQKRMQLIPARRTVRADLIVERHDLVAVIRAEDGNVSCIRLPNEMFDGAHDPLLGAVRIQRIPAVEHLDISVDDDCATDLALDMYRRPVSGSEQSDARM